MATLARLQQQRPLGRVVFVSSEPVEAFKVLHNQKTRLEARQRLQLALESGGRETSLSLLHARVGELEWSLTSVNHVLRTVSKFGEPTFLFAGIADVDPRAFVAITLSKRTPPEEVEHLEDILRHVTQFHVAETKPLQVPSPDQVVSALGKGLMSMLGLGDSKHRQQQQQERRQQQDQEADEARLRQLRQLRQQVQEQEAAERAAYVGSSERERVPRVAVHGQPLPWDVADVVPTAPPAPAFSSQPAAGASGRQAMGVGSRQDASAHLEALKAELAREGTPPSAPDVRARREQGADRSRPAPAASRYPAISSAQPGSRPGGGGWEAHPAGQLGNPFESRGSGWEQAQPWPAHGHAAEPAGSGSAADEVRAARQEWEAAQREAARAQRERAARAERGQAPPQWLEVLGQMMGGGPAYRAGMPAAPDL